MTALTSPRTKLTPPELARLWGVAPETIIAWIRSGQLRAIDVSARPGIGRPRYRIDVADLPAFEAQRQVITDPKPTRRHRTERPAGWVEYIR